MKGSIVKFNEHARCTAAVWCRENDVPGKVVSEQSNYLVVDAGLGYGIYASKSQLLVIAEDGDLETLDGDLLKTAPIPEEDD